MFSEDSFTVPVSLLTYSLKMYYQNVYRSKFEIHLCSRTYRRILKFSFVSIDGDPQCLRKIYLLNVMNLRHCVVSPQPILSKNYRK